jgi:ribosomal protein S18 acetylase RimI-like enzyme
MDGVLDNPVWGALISGNNNLSYGNSNVKYFDQEVSPFAGLKSNSEDNFRLLYELVPHTGTVALMSPLKIPIHFQWGVMHCIEGVQMIYRGGLQHQDNDLSIVPLTMAHVPQMIELTKLTKPGPFASRTIEFGHYEGIFRGNQLVAMTGQRLHVDQYMEISAVCTHPDHRGKGYAKQLIIRQINRIIAASCTPFLHVRNGNDSAIKVYVDLGFVKRSDMTFYFMRKR